MIPFPALPALFADGVLFFFTASLYHRKSEISLYLTNETYEDGEYLYICISDTGNGFSKEALDAIEHDTPIIYHGRHHVGISNIKRRLALMYG